MYLVIAISTSMLMTLILVADRLVRVPLFPVVAVLSIVMIGALMLQGWSCYLSGDCASAPTISSRYSTAQESGASWRDLLTSEGHARNAPPR